MKRKLMLLLAYFFISIGLVIAQNLKVTGVVISEEDGQPVIGASVLVKGTQVGAITDVDGKFHFPNVPSSAKVLVVSYIGMQTEEVTVKPNVKIILKSNTELLEEVMVVAYGTAKKSAFTGSATVVDSKEIAKIQSSNVANALTGKVAGVQLNTASGQPGTTTPSIRVRGISSINAGNNPLIILDGAPFDGDLNNISNQDIETMTVLKDAASNALYGARGANGVIIITTKKGNKGQARITVDAKLGSNSRATQDYDFVKNPAQYYEMYYGALKNYFVEQGMGQHEAHLNANNQMLDNGDYGLGYNVFTTPNGQLLIGDNGKLNPNATLGRAYKNYWLTPDSWVDEAYKTGLRQEYNVSASAGSEHSTFYASVGYLKNEGITIKSDFERLTARLKGDYQLKPWLKVGANMSYAHTEMNALGNDGKVGSSSNIFAFANSIAPIYPLYIRDSQGQIMVDKNGFKMYDYGDPKTGMGLARPILSGGNPYSSVMLDTNLSEGNTFNANGFFEVRFLKDFKFTWNSGVNVAEIRSTGFTNPYYGQYASSNGITAKQHGRDVTYNHQQLLNWRRSFDRHHIEVMAGHEAYRAKGYLLYASRSNVFDPTNLELAGAITENGSNSYITDYNTEGYFGRVQYDFDEKYFLSGSYRRDASSRFHPDHRWGNFWSAGGAWLISKENFFDVAWVDELKLKASYGSQGNDNIGDYRYMNTYKIVNSGGKPAAIPDILGNKNITWETNGNFNAGIEFSVLKHRIKGSLEYFYRKTTDMLFAFPMAPSFGYTYYFNNVGDMRNQGVELELNVTPIQTKDFTWNVGLNLTHYKNKITYLSDQSKTMVEDGVNGYSDGSYFYGEGLPLYTFRMKKYAGVNEFGESLWYKDVLDSKGNAIARKTTTYFDEASYYLCGTALPDVYGGFNTSFSYKGFDLSFDFTYQIGGQVYDSDYAALMASPTKNSRGGNFHADLLKSWTPENPSNSIPRLQYGDSYNSATSDRFLTDASYLSLQNINFGYMVPKHITRLLGLEKLRVYFSADNVWVWSKRQGLDPRQSISGSVTNSYYAPIRTISGGLTLTF